MLDGANLSSLGREQGHKFVITGCCITPKTNRFLTGTPECSYHIQSPEGELGFGWRWLVNLGLVLVTVFLLGSYRSLPDYEL